VSIVLSSFVAVFLWPIVLDEISQHADLFLQVVEVIEVIKLSQSQLTVVIVKTFLGYPNQLGSLL
jgi:hypothetical protein